MTEEIQRLRRAIAGFNVALANASSLLYTNCDEDAYSEWVDKTDFADIWDYLPKEETVLIDAVRSINNGEE